MTPDALNGDGAVFVVDASQSVLLAFRTVFDGVGRPRTLLWTFERPVTALLAQEAFSVLDR
jgi:hypothetical protein